MITTRLFVLIVALSWLALASPGQVYAASELRQSQEFFSPAMQRDMKYSIYLPDGYRTDAPDRYPVVYLLHGLGGSERDWPNVGRAGKTADRLIADKTIQPLVIVMPDGEDSWYVNSTVYGGPGEYETYIVEDLRRYIEKTYSVADSASHRAVAGLSMGGFGAVRLAMKYADQYAAAVSLSGAIVENHTPKKPVTTQQIKLFRGAFGDPFMPKEFNKRNVFAYLDTVEAQPKALRPRILLTVGDDDYFKLYEGAFATFLALKRRKLPHELRVTDGNHKWNLWARELETGLRFIQAEFDRRDGDASETD